MKINYLLIIFVVIGCILAVGYFVRSIDTTTGNTSTTSNTTTSFVNISSPNNTHATVSTHISSSSSTNQGQLLISIGGYNAQLPVFIDNIRSGNVSKDIPLSLKLPEGFHTVKICSGTMCETLDVNIISATKTSIDFEEMLNRDLPQGLLKVSIGDYNIRLPVFIDNEFAGNVSMGNPLSLKVSSGSHSVKICINPDCYNENVDVTPLNETLVDFGSRLKVEGRMADLIVSIGGYNAQKLPVFLENTKVGVASQGDHLTIKVSTGVHEVKVCSGMVCPTKKIEVKFGKQNFIDFGDELIKNAEFQEPTVRILDYTLSGSTMILNTEFINPLDKDRTITATFSCTYTYIDSTRNRVGSSTAGQLSRSVKAGNRTLASTNLYLSGGRDYMPSPPVVLTVTTS